MTLHRSWVEGANDPETNFPLNNLPYGSFVKMVAPHLGEGAFPHCCVAIGDHVLDVTTMEADGLISTGEMNGIVLSQGNWTNFMACGPDSWSGFRKTLTELLREGSPQAEHIRPYLHPLETAELVLPFVVSEYTDFYASRHHAQNVGTMFRGPDNALPPNWLHMPIGYNGRASSVVVSGTDVTRPYGQLKGEAGPRFGPSERFDIELELGAIVGTCSDGPLSVSAAFDNIFGYVLLNDWSARDIQAWEYQPLGPFQAKATATSISPWIVPAAALEPFRVDAPKREHPLLPHLTDDGPMLYDIDLEVGLAPAGQAETIIARTNARELYYSAAQQLAHHASCGCPMRVGDLLGSGTISGPERENRGSLLELSWGGTEPFKLDTGEMRRFIEDGDTLTLRGAARGKGYKIGFGACTGTVCPAR